MALHQSEKKIKPGWKKKIRPGRKEKIRPGRKQKIRPNIFNILENVLYIYSNVFSNPLTYILNIIVPICLPENKTTPFAVAAAPPVEASMAGLLMAGH